MEWHWFLSFRDAKENVSLGGCMVVVEDADPPYLALAAAKAHLLGCNPGGELLGFTAEGSSPEIAAAVQAMPEGELMTREQVNAIWEKFGVQAGRPPRKTIGSGWNDPQQ